MSDALPDALYYVVYTSTAVTPFSDGQLIELLRRSRNANASHKITGALIYKNGVFIQLLEGAEADVEALRERIYNDLRHHAIITLTQGHAELRVFAEWTMHYMPVRERDAAEQEANYRCLKGKGDMEDMLESRGQYHASPGDDTLHPGLRLLLMCRQIL